MGSRGEGLALALLRVALGLLWLQDLVLPRLGAQSWTAGGLGLEGAAGWLLPALEVAANASPPSLFCILAGVDSIVLRLLSGVRFNGWWW